MTTASYGLGDRRHPGTVAYGPVLGVLATGAGLAAAELVAGLIRGTKSPVIAAGEEFIDRSPEWLTDWAKQQFGTADKDVLIGGAFVTIIAIGIVVGIAAVRGMIRFAVCLTVLTGLIGAWAVHSRPGYTTSHLWPTIAGTAASLGVLWWYRQWPTHDARPDGPDPAIGVGHDDAAVDGATPSPPGAGADATGPDGTETRIVRVPAEAAAKPAWIDRRSFVAGAVALGSGAAIAAGGGRILQRRFSVASERSDLALPSNPETLGALPANADLGLSGVSPFIVSNDDFYRIDTALVVPQLLASDWELRVTGMVDRELTINYEQLAAMPQVERHVTLSCVSNYVGGPYVGNALWQGTLLAPVLERAGVQPGAEQLVSRSYDGWTAGSPIEQIMDGRDAIVAIGMNGEPLPAAHGYPVRLVVPGLYGYVSATKWVTELEVTTWDAFDAYWVPRGWSEIAPFKMTTRIDTPSDGSSRAAGAVAVGGVAWYPHVGIRQVQVSIDDGEWQEADLGGVPTNDTWRQWVYRWDAEPGRHEIRARAIDTNGDEQIAEEVDVRPNGASGYHTIGVEITS